MSYEKCSARISARRRAQPHQSIRKVRKASQVGVNLYVRKLWEMHPPCLPTSQGNIAFFTMTIGDYVTVGAKSVVCAAHIGPWGCFTLYSFSLPAWTEGVASRLSPHVYFSNMVVGCAKRELCHLTVKLGCPNRHFS